jgi:Mce-associated membrane protein
VTVAPGWSSTVLEAGDPAPELLASWSRRVVARLLDHALLATVGFLAFPVQPVDVPSFVVGFGRQVGPTAASWWSDGWAVGAVVVGLLMQAYLGSTPGKLVAGVTVVRLADGRPAGLLRTIGREVAHVLDSILLLGFLRPLWNRRRQTFADSLVGTVALVARGPGPVAVDGEAGASDGPGRLDLVTRPPGPVAVEGEGGGPQRPSGPGGSTWRRAATVGATAACALALAFQVSMSSTGDGATFRSCSVPATSVMLSAADVEAHPGTATVRRLWVERQQLLGEPGVVVVWALTSVPTGTGPAGDPILRVTFTRADGTGARTVDHTLVDGQVEGARGRPLDDGRTGVRLPLDVVADLGDGWGADVSVVVDGQFSGTCRVA